MKKNWKKFAKIILTMFIALCVCFVFWGHKSDASAGHGVSHSSGGSSHSSSSHSSSSSSRSSSRSSYSSSSSRSSSSSSSSGSSSPGSALATLIIIVVIIIIICASSSKSTKKPITTTTKLVNNPNAIKTIKELLPNFNEEEFLKDAYKIFLDIEDAWMNFTLDKVQDVMTDEMYNMYDSELAAMEIKGEQNITKDFKLKDSAIVGAVKQNDNIEIKTQYIVEFYDYIINKETKKVVSGKSSIRYRVHFELTYIMSDTQEKIDKCPNCGAKVNVNAAGTCEYCGSKIVGKNTKWIMSKNVVLNQKEL